MGAESLLGGLAGATPWGAIASAAGGLINAGVGFAQRAKGKKLLKQLGDAPTEQIPNAVLQNQKMAQLSANTGLPQEQYNNAIKNLQRNQMIALRGASDRHGGLSLLAGSEQGLNDSTLKLDVADAAARTNNQKTLYGINNQVGNWQDRVWQNNVNNPYMRKMAYANSLLGIGNQNASTGVDQLAGAGALFAGSGGIRRRTPGNSGGGTNGYGQGYDPNPSNSQGYSWD